MKYILIDLDGTLTNPKLGITKSIQYALKAMNIQEEDLDSLCKYIGPPLWESFGEFHGLDAKKTEEAIAKYREYYSERGLYENEKYEGIEKVLEKLKEAGKVLIVATSKPEVFAEKILHKFDLAQYFADICGASLDPSRISKEAVIRYAIDRNGIKDLTNVLMVGDRLHDVEGAKALGIPTLGVLYGFGSREELEGAGADKIAETVEDLYSVIMSYS